MEIVEPIQLKEKTTQTDTAKSHITRILVVEDDPTFKPIWNYILESADRHSRLTWANSVDAAEEKMQRAFDQGRGFDLVIADIFLSGNKTGFDLWQEYEAQLVGRMLMVSSLDRLKMMRLMSGHSNPPPYIRKPLVLEECIETIYEMLHPTTPTKASVG